MKNKNGISAVVATVLIILITVAAVTIIWAAIIPMVKTNLDEATFCSSALTSLNIVSGGYTCFDKPGKVVKVQVEHGAKEIGLIGIQVLISDDAGDSSSRDVIVNLPGINERKVLLVDYNERAANSVSIAPIIRVGEQEKTCDAISSVQLSAC